MQINKKIKQVIRFYVFLFLVLSTAVLGILSFVGIASIPFLLVYMITGDVLVSLEVAFGILCLYLIFGKKEA